MMNFIRRFFVFVAACPALFAQDDYQPRNTQAPGEEPPTGQEAADLITVPEGFQVKLFAGDPDVRQPVAMALDDRGRLFVAESYSYKEWEKTGEDRVLIFEDTDNDGVHDSRKIFTAGIDHLSGMTVGWGGVWVCSAPNLLFYPDKNRDDIPDGEPEIILDGWTTKAGHNFFNGLTWGPDGWLYGRHGITKPSKVGRPGTPDAERIEFDCAIWRYHPVTTEFEVVCRGTTNPWGMDWNAAGELFFTNNVNGHLWHGIPGAFYPRMGERDDPFSKFVYDRIGMCCDHLHHAGAHTDWTKTRDGKGVHGELGGGHSHCGGMIYLGGKWPEKYRDKIFMCNTHGRRVNVDRMEPSGATYVGKHEPDFLQANNPWFRGVELLYGPDGDVYLSDWVDNGECHDNDGVHRTSGRIYKIIYGEPSPPMEEKLWKMSDGELAALQDHPNEWYIRKARWILLERMASKGRFSRADWTSILPDHMLPQGNVVREIEESNDPVVLRKYASELSKSPSANRWEPASKLLAKTASLQSEMMQLLIYYGVKDIVAENPAEAHKLLKVAADSHPTFTKNLSQNLAENGVFEPLVTMLINSDNESVTEAVLAGFSEGIRGQKKLSAPEGWTEFVEGSLGSPEVMADVLAIDYIFDKDGTRNRIEGLLKSETFEDRRMALAILRDLPGIGIDESLLPLAADPKLGADAIAVLSKSSNVKIANNLISEYGNFPQETKPLAINALSNNRVFAAKLLGAIEAGAIPRHAVTAFHARQILTYKDEDLKKQLAKVWGKTGSTSGEKKAEIKKWQNQLLPDVLAKADVKNGHEKFQQLCMACHNLHGEGGAIGPELTGANRGNLYYLLENIIDPGATLPADFRMTVVTKKDKSVVSGMIKGENEYSITIKTLADEQIISLDEISKRETLEQSIMPEGLLKTLNDADVRDLIAFLQK